MSERLRAAVRSAWRSRVVRLATGISISAAFLAVAVSRVDLAETLAALAAASPAWIALAVAIVVVELVIRSERWRFLLSPTKPVASRLTFAYLNIGYFANTLLPARLGDAARAVLAGRATGISSISVFGTIVVERVTDATMIAGAVIMSSLVVARGSGMAGTAVTVAAALLAGATIVLAIAVGITRSRALPEPWATRGALVWERFAGGAAALHTPWGMLGLLAFTLLAFAAGVCAFGATARSVGLELSIGEWALVLGALALSTAIPAAPGSLGTYELVGVATLGMLGVDPSDALAVTVLIHAIAMLPPAIIGLVSTWILHVRVTELDPAGPLAVAAAVDG